MTMQNASIPGIEALVRYIEARGQTVHGFALENGLDPSELSKLLRGHKQRVSVEMAQKIEKATDGYVEWHLWVPQ